MRNAMPWRLWCHGPSKYILYSSLQDYKRHTRDIFHQITLRHCRKDSLSHFKPRDSRKWYLTGVLSALLISGTDHGDGVHVPAVVLAASARGLIDDRDCHLSQNSIGSSTLNYITKNLSTHPIFAPRIHLIVMHWNSRLINNHLVEKELVFLNNGI